MYFLSFIVVLNLSRNLVILHFIRPALLRSLNFNSCFSPLCQRIGCGSTEMKYISYSVRRCGTGIRLSDCSRCFTITVFPLTPGT